MKHQLCTLASVLIFFFAITSVTAKVNNPQKPKNTESNKYYPSTLEEGLIGKFDERPLDSPTDNVFSVTIDELPAADEEVWLTYELYGITNYTGISRSINDQLSVGGYFVNQDKSWKRQDEQLKSNWLKKGINNIRFTLPENATYNYRIRSLGILIKKTGIHNRAIVINQPITQEYTNNLGYIQGFIEGSNCKGAQIFVDGTRINLITSEFEVLIPKTTKNTNWNATVKVVFPDGEIIEKQVSFKTPTASDYQNKIEVRSADYNIAEYTPVTAFQLEVKGAAIAIQPQSSLENLNISITALRDVDIPVLDAALVNVTKIFDGYRFLPHGTKFNKEEKVSLEYDPAKIPDGYTEKDIRTYYFDENAKQWVALKLDSLQADKHIIVSLTNHFTDMVNAIIKVPESPETEGYLSTSMKDVKAASPFTGVTVISPPEANNMGNANIHYPINLPAGRQGMQPDLSIQYSSGADNNWLGLGWNLNIPAIEVDTRWGVPRYQSKLETETYLMDGEQLAPVAHRGDLATRTENKMFYPRVEHDFKKITRHGNNPGNYWWEIIDKSGVKYFYGGSTSGIVETAVLRDANNNIAHWSLVEVRDLNDNFIHYHYVKLAENNTTRYTTIGNNNYIDRITYTGHGSEEGKYEVLFTRDREINNATLREDVIINARFGFKRVIGDLLRKIEIKYNGNSIRSYELAYTTGAFYKTLLQKITEFDAAGQEFNHHDFDYYNDVKVGENYEAYFAEENWQPQDDHVQGNFILPPFTIPGTQLNVNDYASAINGTKSFGGGFGIAVTVGVDDLQWFNKNSTVGGNFGMSFNQGDGMLSLIDIDGDNLPDKVYTDDGVLKFRQNLSGTTSNFSFGPARNLIGVNSFSSFKSLDITAGIEAHFGLFVGLQYNYNKTTIKTYFSDVNGDGLMDVVKNGIVYFNHLENGVPHFTQSSGDTPSGIGGSGPGIDPNLVTIDPQETENLIDQNPLHDIIRVWEAPYDGIISIDAPISLLSSTEPSVDGIRAAIQHNDSEIWNTNIPANDFAQQNPNITSLAVSRNDRIYFRVQSVMNGEGDVVDWNPVITYSQDQSGLVDANGLPIYKFKASDGFVVSGSQIVGAPIDGTIAIDGLFEKPAVTDDLTVKIKKNGDVIWEHTYLSNEVISQQISINAIDTEEDDEYEFSITSPSNVNWKAINWHPRIYYTASSSAAVSTVTNPDGSPMIQFSPAVYYGIYDKIVRPTGLWTATVDGDITVNPYLTFPFIFDYGDMTFTVKKNNVLVARREFQVIFGFVDFDSFTFPASIGEVYSFDISSSDASISGSLDSSEIKLNFPDNEITIQAGLVTQRDRDAQPEDVEDVTVLFGAMYQHWGQFGYNGNRGRASEIIHQNELKIVESDADDDEAEDLSDDLHDDTSVEEMDESFSDQGGRKVSDEKFILLLPDNKNKLWKGYDDKNWAGPTSVSASRLGLDDMIVENPAANGGTGARGIDKVTDSHSVGFNAGVSGGVGSVGGSYAQGNTKTITEFEDLNGDRYPDLISSDKVQFTKANGTFELTAAILPAANYLEVKHNNTALSVNGAPAISKSMISSGIPKGTKASNAVYNKKGAEVSSTKEDDASHTLGISGSLGTNKEHATYAFLDINGDTLPDKLYNDGKVQLNLGYGFGPIEDWHYTGIRDGEGNEYSAGLGISLFDNSIGAGIGLNLSNSWALNGLQDVNGDGLPDHLVKNGGTVEVYLNTGNKFKKVEWNGINDIQQSVAAGESANIAFTVAFGIFGVKIAINPSGHISHSASKEIISISDINGDSYPDILTSNKDNELKVKRSKIERTNLLKEVKRPLGANFTMDYARTGNTYEQPNDVWALSKVEVYDGFGGDGEDTAINTFEYEQGHFDRHEREFYGFKIVKTNEVNPQDNTVYRQFVNEYLNANFYEKGALSKEIVKDAEGRLFTETINYYDFKNIATGETLSINQLNDRGSVFLATAKTQEDFYEGGNTPQKTTSTTYQYDLRGNVISTTDFGDTGDEDDVTTTIEYYSIPNVALFNVPKSSVVSHGGQTLRKTETSINTDTGDITQIRKFLQNNTVAKYDLVYDGYGNLTKITRPENSMDERLFFQYEYDDEVHSYITKITDGYGYSSASTYDFRFGQKLLTTDLNGQQIRYEVDNVGRIKAITGPFELEAGKPYTIAFEYHLDVSPPWARTKHFDPSHPTNDIEVVTFTDGLSRVIQVKKDTDLYVGPQVADQEKMIVSGKVIYDAFGREIESYYPVIEPKGSEGTFNTNVDSMTPTKTTYDVLGRVLTVTLPDNTVNTTIYGFGNDREGTLQFSKKAIDGNGIWKEIFTNVRGLTTALLEQYSQGSNVWTSSSFNALDELIAVKDDQGNQIHTSYDWLGRKIQVIHPDEGTTTFEYDLANNMIKKFTANLSTETPISYIYDKERLSRVSYPLNPQNNVRLTYGAAGAISNRAGRIALVEDATGAEEFFYDKLGSKTKSIRTILVPHNTSLTYMTQWTYDTWNRVTEMIYPDQEKVTYNYNLGGLLNSFKGVKNGTEFNYVTQLGYDKFEQRSYLKFGNGTETFYSYEPERRRMHSLIVETAANRRIMDNLYTYDNESNILRLQNNATVPHSNLMGGKADYNYTYDDLYRLMGATGSYTDRNHENRFELGMQYNSVSGIIKKEQLHQRRAVNSSNWTPRNQTTYTYDYGYEQEQPHAAKHIGDKTYTYDANGNQTGWENDGNGQRRQIVWDEENRIKAIADNGAVNSYVYDAAGERVLKSHGGGQIVAVNGRTANTQASIGNYTVYVNPFLVVRSSQVTKHFYIEGERIVTKLNESNEGLLQGRAGGNTAQIDYSQKQSLLEKDLNKIYADFNVEVEKETAKPADKASTPTAENTQSNGNGSDNENRSRAVIYYYHPDHLGNSAYITDANGEVFQHLEYFPFGETFIEEHSNTETTPYLYNGKELDEETSLYYYGARYYDPRESIWASVDPLATKYPNSSPYAYCANNPVKFIDPNGRDLTMVVAVAAVIVAAIAWRNYSNPIISDGILHDMGYRDFKIGDQLPNFNYEDFIQRLRLMQDPLLDAQGAADLKLDLAQQDKLSLNDRTGKDFTTAGKRSTRKTNKTRNNGVERCDYCDVKLKPPKQKGVPYDEDMVQVDHVKAGKGAVPGQGVPNNGAAACSHCNNKKSNKTTGTVTVINKNHIRID